MRAYFICLILPICTVASQSSAHDPKVMLKIAPEYFKNARATGGDFYFLAPGELTNLKIMPSPHGAIFLEYGSLNNESREFIINVDKYYKKISFLAGVQSKNSIALLRPNVKTVTFKEPGVTMQELSHMLLVTIDKPEPGEWKMRVNGSGLFEVSARVDGNDSKTKEEMITFHDSFPLKVQTGSVVFKRVSQKEIPDIDDSSLSKQGKRKIRLPYYNSQNELTISNEIVTNIIQGLCSDSPPAVLDGTESNRTLMINPRVDTQRCPISEKFPLIGQTMIVGLDSSGKIIWKRALEIKEVAPAASSDPLIDYRTIIGASIGGIIIRSNQHESMEIISPQTGETLYGSVKGSPWTGVMDPHSHYLYVDKPDTINRRPTQIFRIDLQNDSREILDELPLQKFTGIAMLADKMAISPDGRFLIVATNIPSKIDASMGWRIYDLSTKHLIDEMTDPKLYELEIAVGLKDHIGFSLYRDGKRFLKDCQVKHP